MLLSEHPQPLIAIVGPTGTGKSALGFYLARRFHGEVINADSRQVYRGMDVGTAKPSARERAAVPCHLFDLADPDEPFSLAQFLTLARRTIQAVHRRGRVPILVGGSGQYVWALLEGWETPAAPPNRELRQKLEAEAQETSVEALHHRLQLMDPAAAARTDPHNLRRVVRALEVVTAIGRVPPFSERRQSEFSRRLVVGLTTTLRAELYQLLDERVEAMLAEGWVEEVRRLLESGYSEELPALSSLGYRELALYIRGDFALVEAVRLVKLAHHRLARRQYTWFKPADPRIRWLLAGEEGTAQAGALTEELLAGQA